MKCSNLKDYFVSTLQEFKSGVPQKEIATLVNVSESTISKMINSERVIFVCLNKDGYYLTETKKL